MIDNLVMKKYPKGFYEIKCKHVDESIKNEFSYYFPLGNKHVEGDTLPTSFIDSNVSLR
jgi:hypothetical protein